MISVARQIQEKCREQNQELFMAFIDLTKAFNSINREALWKVLSRFGCPANFIIILRLLHDKMTETMGLKLSLSPTEKGSSKDALKHRPFSLSTYAPSFYSFATNFPMALNLTTGLMGGYLT